MYLLHHLPMLTLIYQKYVFCTLNVWYLNTNQCNTFYDIDNHLYWDSTCNLFQKNVDQLILYIYTNIYHGFIFALNYVHFHWIYNYTYAIDAELKNLVSLSPNIKLNTFRFILEFTSITVGLAWHGWLFKDTHFVATDPLKHDSPINTCLINLHIII